MSETSYKPHNLEAEQSVLGAMLLDKEAVTLAVETLDAEDFFLPANRDIFLAMQMLSAVNRPVDLVTVLDELERRGKIESVGGVGYLTELSRYVPTTANASYYIQIVEEKATLRKLIDAGSQIMAEATAAEDPVPDILDAAEKRIYNIAKKRGSEALKPLNPILLDVYAQIEQLAIHRGEIPGVPSGFLDLDKLTMGFHGGEFILVGARPSMGKTSFMLNVGQYAAQLKQKKVAYFSLEMPCEQLGMRILCAEAMVDLQAVRMGNLGDDGWNKLADAMTRLSIAPMFFDDTSSISIPEIRSRCRRLQIEQGLDIVMIDYLQLMTASGRYDSRQNEVSAISRQLKILAQELGVPIVVGSQLSRASQNRADHRPVLSDLRDSGAIEQDADVVMFLHREDYYNPDTEMKNIAEVILSKQRNGPLGTVQLAWNAQFTRFSNLAPGQQTPPA